MFRQNSDKKNSELNLLLPSFLLIFAIFIFVETCVCYYVYASRPVYKTEVLFDFANIALNYSLEFLLRWIIAFLLILIFFHKEIKEARRIKISESIKLLFKKLKFSLTYPGAIITSVIIIHIFLALPWIFAFHGKYIDSYPVLNKIFIAKRLCGHHAAVHLGTHHGYTGLIGFVLGILVFSLASNLEGKRGKIVRFFVAFSIPYSLNNFWEDFISEQIGCRGFNISLPYMSDETAPLIAAMLISIYLIGGLIIYLFGSNKKISGT